jgi:uroporphyrinogen decarboxylase
MLETGLDGLQALQPTCRGMNPADLKSQFGTKITLMGAVNTQLLIEGTPAQARAETQRVLDVMKPGGGYICSPSHDYLLPETPVENVIAMYETLHEYGSYR